MKRPLGTHFWQERHPLSDTDAEALEAALEAAVAPGQDRTDVDPVGFVRFLASKVKPDRDPVEALRSLQVDDLRLAYACLEGSDAAVTRLGKLVQRDLRAVLSTRPALMSQSDDLAQNALERLLVGTGEAGPRIADYAGTGTLRGWLRVMLTRLVLDAATRGPRERAEPEDALVRMSGAAGDLELDALRDRHGKTVQDAIARALQELPARERALLKQRYLQQSSVDEIATAYGIHRVTAARQLSRARELLSDNVRSRLAEALGISAEDIDSLIRTLRSQLDVRLSAVFRTESSNG